MGSSWRGLRRGRRFWDCVRRADCAGGCGSCRNRGSRFCRRRAASARCCRRWSPRSPRCPCASAPPAAILRRSNPLSSSPPHLPCIPVPVLVPDQYLTSHGPGAIRSFPQIIEPHVTLEELCLVREVFGNVAEEQVEQGAPLLFRVDER